MHKNIFDQLKYAWEQTQWADKLATLHNTLTTVRQQLETANMVKQAIGDPVAAIALIDNGLFSDFLQDSGITDTLTDLAGIAQEGVQLSATIQELFQPIDLSAWANLSNVVSFEGTASFRNSGDPLERFRAVENAFSRFEILIGKAQNKRRALNFQIARINSQAQERERRRGGAKARWFTGDGTDRLGRHRLRFRLRASASRDAARAQSEPSGGGGNRRRRNQPQKKSRACPARSGRGSRPPRLQRTES